MEILSTPRPAANVPSPTSPKPQISSDFDTFLRMLTAQMKNQDPLNPVDSTDFATQLATFSAVEQAVTTNDLLRALSAQLGAAGLSDMATWVGKEVRVAAPAYFDGGPITIYPNPLPQAQSGEIVVRDMTGFEVQRVPVPAASDALQWTGTDARGYPMVHGAYEFTYVSLVDGQPIGATPVEVYSQVTEVRSDMGQITLIMKGGIAVAAQDVTALREAGL